MCGITAIYGKNIISKLLKSLKELQNRGYDSAGISFINENKEVPPYKSDSSTLEHFGKMGFLKALNYIEVI